MRPTIKIVNEVEKKIDEMVDTLERIERNVENRIERVTKLLNNIEADIKKLKGKSKPPFSL